MPNLLELGGMRLEQRLMRQLEIAEFAPEQPRQILLFPGMLAPVVELSGLVDHLRAQVELTNCGVTAVPLGLSMRPLPELLGEAERLIKSELQELGQYDELVLFGHSHGGRVVAALGRNIQKTHPKLKLTVITAGTPIVTRPRRLPLYKKWWNSSLSRAFRHWPAIEKPIPNDHVRYIGLYSPDDLIVDKDAATEGHTGELVKMPGLSHMDFLFPEKVGKTLLQQLAPRA